MKRQTKLRDAEKLERRIDQKLKARRTKRERSERRGEKGMTLSLAWQSR